MLHGSCGYCCVQITASDRQITLVRNINVLRGHSKSYCFILQIFKGRRDAESSLILLITVFLRTQASDLSWTLCETYSLDYNFDTVKTKSCIAAPQPTLAFKKVSSY